MWLELPTLDGARGLVWGHQAILDHPCDSIESIALFVTGAGRVATKRVVVGVNKVVFHGDRNGSVEEHGAFSLRKAAQKLTMHYAIMHSENQGCLTVEWFSSPVWYL